MRKGGVIRLVTPDLAAITGLYSGGLSVDQKNIFVGLSDVCSGGIPAQSCGRDQCNVSSVGTSVHLRRRQRWPTQCALPDLVRRPDRPGSSDLSDLQKLENEKRYPEGLLNFESLALEGASTRGTRLRLIPEIAETQIRWLIAFTLRLLH